MGFVDRVPVQCAIIFPERGVQEKEGKKKTYATNISI